MIHTGRLIKKVGLDTDVMIALIDDLEQFSLFKPKIFTKKNALFINYVVFGELMGHFVKGRNLKEDEARNKIFIYLRKNRIGLLKKKNTDQERMNEIFDKLKKQRQLTQNLAGDKDLKIISVYKFHDIDLVISRNTGHFEQFCNYLDIAFEKLEENVDTMLRRALGWKKRR